jgi:hypothetical protein
MIRAISALAHCFLFKDVAFEEDEFLMLSMVFGPLLQELGHCSVPLFSLILFFAVCIRITAVALRGCRG